MSRSPIREKYVKSVAKTTAVALPTLDKGGAAALTPMNFRVPEAFHREFKLYAVQHGMSMVDLLQQSFRLLKEKRAR